MSKHPFILSATVDFPDDVFRVRYDSRCSTKCWHTLRVWESHGLYWSLLRGVDQDSLGPAVSTKNRNSLRDSDA